jgi:serine/threonine protein phosphatase PrpC
MRNFLKQFPAKLFPSRKQSSASTSLPPTNNSAPEFLAEASSQLIAASALDIGRRRDNNEDSLFSFSSTLSVESEKLAFGLYAVADGMGGHQSGELASEAALRAFANHIIKQLYLPRLVPKAQSLEKDALTEIMSQAMEEAHFEVGKAAPGGGCTLTAALTIGDEWLIAHIGDSRAYELNSDGEMRLLTRDHTLVKLLEEQGQITAEEAADHPQKSVLYRALGQGEAIEADMFSGKFPVPGYLLLCSDGLWGVIEEDEILEIVNSTDDPHMACQRLAAAANAAGGPDNISVLLVRLTS